jgi:hypothetical protein
MPVFDPMFTAATQTRQAFHLPLGIPHLQVVGMESYLNPFADQTASHRVGVAADMNRAAAIHPDLYTLAGVQPLRRQRP